MTFNDNPSFNHLIGHGESMLGNDDAGDKNADPSRNDPTFAVKMRARLTLLISGGVHVQQWIRRHPRLALTLLANAIFVFLPFYDANNIPLVIATTSHFTSSSPPTTLSLWVAGPFINAMYIPGYLGYLISGYQLYWTYTTYKLIFFGVTGLLALLLFRLAARHDGVAAERIAFFTLANPVWWFVNYIWVNYDIFPVVLFAFGYATLRYVRPSGRERRRIGTVTVLLTMSIFFYWFALILVPTLLLYSRGWSERLRLFAILLVGLLLLFLANILFFAGGQANYVGTLLGVERNFNATQSFGLQYFVPLAPITYAIFLFGVAFLLPFLLRRLRFDEPSTSFVLVTLLIFSAPFALPDNYILVFPFVAFLALERLPKRVPYGMLYGLLAYPITGVTLINFYIHNSQPDGVGLFYWGYDLFRSDIRFLDSYEATQQFLLLFNVALLLAVAGSLLLLFRIRPSVAKPMKEIYGPARGEGKIPLQTTRRPRLLAVPVLGLAALVAGLGAVALLFNAYLPNAILYDGSGPPPTFILTPTFWPENQDTNREPPRSWQDVPRPIPGATYGSSGNTLEVFVGAPPLVFGRWFDDHAVRFGGSLSLRGNLPPYALVINGSPFSMAVLNISQPDASMAYRLKGAEEGLVTNVNLPYPLLNRTSQAYVLGGKASLVYDLDDSAFIGHSFVFAFDIVARGALQTNVLHIQNAENFVALVSYPRETFLVYGGAVSEGRFVVVPVPGVVALAGWNFVEFTPTATSFSVNLNGARATASVDLFPGGTEEIRIGVPFPGGERGYSLNGTVTDLFSASSPMAVSESYLAELESLAGTYYQTLPSPDLTFLLKSTLTSSEIAFDGAVSFAPSPTTSLYVGKFQSGGYSIRLSITRFDMQQAAPDQYYLVPVFASFVTPYVALSYVARRFRW